jgi:hypothetical protein
MLSERGSKLPRKAEKCVLRARLMSGESCRRRVAGGGRVGEEKRAPQTVVGLCSKRATQVTYKDLGTRRSLSVIATADWLSAGILPGPSGLSAEQ